MRAPDRLGQSHERLEIGAGQRFQVGSGDIYLSLTHLVIRYDLEYGPLEPKTKNLAFLGGF